MIGTIPHASDAERFSDFLVAQKIENMVEESNAGGWSVWVENDDDVERGKRELDEFLRSPFDQRYDASSQAAKVRAEQAKKQQRKRTQYIDVRTRWGQPKQWAAPVTLVLIAMSCILSLASGSMFGAPRQPLFDALLFTSVDPGKIEQYNATHPQEEEELVSLARYWMFNMRTGQIWRIVTPIFVHFGVLHLLFNMFWLRDLGGMMEIRRGTWRMLALVLVCTLLSNFGEYFWTGVSVFGGMSGVVYGLFGYVWVKDRYEPQLGLAIAPQSSIIMIGWLIICMLGVMGPVANAAHLIGMLSGAVIAYGPVGVRKIRAKKKTWG